MTHPSSSLTKEARAVILAVERALKSHLRLIKKRAHLTTLVAFLERLRSDLREGRTEAVRADIKKLNSLTRGFVRRVIVKKRKAR